MKLRKGDTIKVLLGKDRGRTGKVQKVLAKKREALVEGINIYKKHVKPKGEGKPGGIMEMPRPLTISKLALVCPACGKATRVGYQLDKSGEKQRICKKCKAILS